MIITDSDYEGSAIEELGSLFKVTQVFLWLVLTHSLTLIFSLFLLLCNLKTRFYFLTPFCFCRDYGIQVSSSVEQSVRLFFLSFYVHFFFFFFFFFKLFFFFFFFLLFTETFICFGILMRVRNWLTITVLTPFLASSSHPWCGVFVPGGFYLLIVF